MRFLICFSFSLGILFGLGTASRILIVSPVEAKWEGPSISVASSPLILSSRAARAQKMVPAPKPKVRKRTYRKRNRVQESQTKDEKSIAQLVSTGQGN